MTKRYGTLDVSLNASKSSPFKGSKTIEDSQQDESQLELPDPKTNRFKELYYKNERLRKELKVLNQKLNEKLDKLKLPNVKKKAMSVDLNRSPFIKPSKAQMRELQNGYKQIAMYKKQVQVLKGREQTSQNYEKMRTAENMITFMDMEINRIQDELKSQKNIKKIQDRILSDDVENVEVKQRLKDYQKEVKGYKDKMKDMERKSRKRQVEFKKQQAYLVTLKAKIRKFKAEEDQLQKPEPQKVEDISSDAFYKAKQELRVAKYWYDAYCKKIEGNKKKLKDIKLYRTTCDETFLDKQTLLKQLKTQVESFTRLLKDLQLKKYEQTGLKEDQPSRYPSKKDISKILKLEEIEDGQSSRMLGMGMGMGVARQSEHNQSFISKKDSLRQSKIQSEFKNTSNIGKDERNWKGKMRKVSMGYAMPTDQTFADNGIIQGFRVFLDQNRFIVGLMAIVLVQQTRVECQLHGEATGVELKWQAESGDHIGQIAGSFTEQGYLAELKMKTWRGIVGAFGEPQNDKFHFKIQPGEYFSGISGGLRRLGQDIRITQIGFWVLKI